MGLGFEVLFPFSVVIKMMCTKGSWKDQLAKPWSQGRGCADSRVSCQLPTPHLAQVGAQELDLKFSFLLVPQDTEGSGSTQLLSEPKLSRPTAAIVGHL